MDESMPRTRYPFTVVRSSDAALISMNIGGVIRCRHMPPTLLRKVGELCHQLLDASKEDRPEDKDVPLFPGYLSGLKGGITGVCHATLGFHRLDDGTVESVIA